MLNILKKFTQKVETIGFSHTQFTGKTVLLSNHVSLDDIPTLDHVLPQNVVFAISKEYESEYTEILKKRKHIIYDLFDSKSLVRLKDTIEEEVPVLLFPESKLSNTGSFLKIYDDIAAILIKTNPTLYPIFILGMEQANYFPSSTIKIILDSPFQLLLDETLSNEEQREKTTVQILKVFQNGRFKYAQKTNVNLFNELLDVVKKQGEKTVILEDPTSKLTYKDFLLAVYVFQSKLNTLLKRERSVGTLLPTSVGHTITLFSLFKLGITPALLNFTMGEQNLIDCTETAHIQTIITSREFIEKGGLEPLLEPLQQHVSILYLEDIKQSITQSDKIKALSDYTLSRKSNASINELILFTSGSESKPKGVVLTHDNVFSNIHQCLSVIDLTSQDHIFNVLPMFHCFGLTIGTILPVLIGTPVFLYPSPLHYKIIPKLIYQKDSTVLFGTSTFFSMYGSEAKPHFFQNLRIVIGGAEKLKNEVYQLWLEKFGVRILEGYGLTEATPVLALNTMLLNKKGSVGQFIPQLEYKIEPVEGIEEGGNLFIKGPNVMKGYLLHQKGFIPLQDWHDCGDIVKVDSEGFISIVSRLKRFAKVGGEMISLNLVEELLSQCFNFTEVACVAIPDKRKGEQIVLFTTDTSLIKLREFKKFIKTKKYSALLLPREVLPIDSIPVLGTGKTDYVSLQKIANENTL